MNIMKHLKTFLVIYEHKIASVFATIPNHAWVIDNRNQKVASLVLAINHFVREWQYAKGWIFHLEPYTSYPVPSEGQK